MRENIVCHKTLPIYLTQDETYDLIDFIETELIGVIQRSPEMDRVDYVVNLCNILSNLRYLYDTFLASKPAEVIS